MYVGHAAIATFVKAKRPRLALALLLPVAFAPDWVEWLLGALGNENRMLSHSLVSVGVGATLVALVYTAATREFGGGVWLWMTYVSHWAADFITGSKPTWPGGPEVGLKLYMHPVWDVVLESILAIVCWLAYVRTIPTVSRRSKAVWLAPAGLILLQIFVEAADNLPI